MNRVEELEAKITHANELYYNGVSPFTDEEYDAWKDELADLCPESDVVIAVGAEVRSSRWNKVAHQIPMGSQDKVNTIEELLKWSKNRNINCSVSVQEKLDGISLSLNYENGSLSSAITRGAGLIGEDILRNAVKFKGVVQQLPEPQTVSVRGEVLMFKQDWADHAAEMSNPRNAASGIARRIDGGGQEHLSFVAYDATAEFKSESDKLSALVNMGFQVPDSVVCSISQVKELYDQYQNGRRNSLPYEIDGLVIKINNIAQQQALGHHSNDPTKNPLGQVALKFAHEMRESTVVDITWEVGLTGRITPLVWVEPVLIAGAKISKASLYNIRNVENLGVRVGSRVLMSRRNDVIPRLEKVLDNENAPTATVVPTNCPQCGAVAERDGEYLVCKSDDCRITGNIEKWVNLLEMDGVGPKVIESLVAAGLVKSPADLYKLTIKDALTLDRMADRSAEILIGAIQDRKSAPLNVFLAGLNIPSCGRRVFKNIIKAGFDSLDKILALDTSTIAKIDGMGDITGHNVVMGLDKRAWVIEDLLAAGFVIVEETIGNKPLSGRSFCFTGKMERPRGELEKMAQDQGAEIKSVSKDLTYLVIADPNSSSSKAIKARKYNVNVISEVDFLKMVEQA